MKRLIVIIFAVFFLTPAYAEPPPEHIRVEFRFDDGVVVEALVPAGVGDFTEFNIMGVLPVSAREGGDVCGVLVQWGERGAPVIFAVVFDFNRQPRVLVVAYPAGQLIWVYKDGVPVKGTDSDLVAALERLELEATGTVI